MREQNFQEMRSGGRWRNNCDNRGPHGRMNANGRRGDGPDYGLADGLGDAFQGGRGNRWRDESRCGQERGRGPEVWGSPEGGPFHPGFMGGGPRGRHGGPGGRSGGGGDGRGQRRGRFLGQGDIRLLALALIEQEPRHGYDIIKEVETLTNGSYAPSPGVIYPTLTYLEEAGQCNVETEGNKKRYAITPEGSTQLEEQRSEVTRILDLLKAMGDRARQESESSQRAAPSLPLSVETALLNLRETAAERIKQDPAASSKIVQKLLQLAEDL
ncbi:PadR family transcriptional regulator [Cohaesibacter haloalkalitolerans]|uniref:PadR family transcriptional regulator n=1 Tax=Cohaesibacter haloalkalitolerans TaxID=1162980 RepID=UPI001FE0B8D1|nr:PadR family transcriptional regulator [Cohaesibacter haloalkalitolerans]